MGVEPGWLARSVAQSKRSMHRLFTPRQVMAHGMSVTLPISSDEAAELYRSLNEHFEAWTGKTLAEYQRTTP